MGRGLLESAYAECLEMEMHGRGLRFERQCMVPIVYKGRRLVTTYRPTCSNEQHIAASIGYYYNRLSNPQ